MAMKLLKLYESLLAVAKRVVNEDGTVSQSFGGKTEPTLVKGKREVLPTKEHLSNPDWSNRVVFHPLSENVLRGESTVLEDFRQAINVRINWTIGLLGYQLLMIAGSEDEHKKLSPDQTEYLSIVKNVKDTTLASFRALMKAMPMDQTQKAFVSVYLKRGGSIDGKRHARVGVVTFPLYQELAKLEGLELWGVKFKNKKDIEAIKKLLEYMIPGIEKPESHNRGSDSGVAPYLDALMKAVMSVGSPLNDIIDMFHNILAVNNPDDDAHPDKLRFNDEWVETFDNLDVMIPEIRAIPMQAGNDGAKPATPATPATTAPATAAPAGPLPAALTNPQPAQQPAVGGWGAQQTSAFAAAAAAPGPVHTGRGLDFESLLKSNPALAQQVGGVGAPSWGGGQARPQERQPGWAQPSGNQGWGNQGGNTPGWAQGNQGGGNWGGGSWGNNSGPYSPSI